MTTSGLRRWTAVATACACPPLLISPYARRGFIDHQTLSFDAYLKFIEDDFLGGERVDPATDGRPDSRPDVRENAPQLGNLADDFDFSQAPRAPMLLPLNPHTDLLAPAPTPLTQRPGSGRRPASPARAPGRGSRARHIPAGPPPEPLGGRDPARARPPPRREVQAGHPGDRDSPGAGAALVHPWSRRRSLSGGVPVLPLADQSAMRRLVLLTLVTLLALPGAALARTFSARVVQSERAGCDRPAAGRKGRPLRPSRASPARPAPSR